MWRALNIYWLKNNERRATAKWRQQQTLRSLNVSIFGFFYPYTKEGSYNYWNSLTFSFNRKRTLRSCRKMTLAIARQCSQTTLLTITQRQSKGCRFKFCNYSVGRKSFPSKKKCSMPKIYNANYTTDNYCVLPVIIKQNKNETFRCLSHAR